MEGVNGGWNEEDAEVRGEKKGKKTWGGAAAVWVQEFTCG